MTLIIIIAYILITVLLFILFMDSHKLTPLFAVLLFALLEIPLLLIMDLPLPPDKYALPALLLIVPHALITVWLMRFIKKKDTRSGLLTTLASMWGVIGFASGLIFLLAGPDLIGPFTDKPNFDKAEIVIADSSDISKEEVENAIEAVKASITERGYDHTIFRKFEYRGHCDSFFESDGKAKRLTIYTEYDVSKRKANHFGSQLHMSEWLFTVTRETPDSEWVASGGGYA